MINHGYCTQCDGMGEEYFNDEWNPSTEDYGRLRKCDHCQGSGIEPGFEGEPWAEYETHDPLDDLRESGGIVDAP